MAFYVFHPTVAASTTTTQEERISAGTITRISALFPTGCCGLVRIRVKINDVQIWPRNANDDVFGDNETVVSDSDIPVTGNSLMKIVIENTDDTYSHTPEIRIDIEDAKRQLTDSGLKPVTNPIAQISNTQPAKNPIKSLLEWLFSPLGQSIGKTKSFFR